MSTTLYDEILRTVGFAPHCAIENDHGKPFTMFPYNVGGASFGETEAKFARRPEWRSA